MHQSRMPGSRPLAARAFRKFRNVQQLWRASPQRAAPDWPAPAHAPALLGQLPSRAPAALKLGFFFPLGVDGKKREPAARRRFASISLAWVKRPPVKSGGFLFETRSARSGLAGSIYERRVKPCAGPVVRRGCHSSPAAVPPPKKMSGRWGFRPLWAWVMEVSDAVISAFCPAPERLIRTTCANSRPRVQFACAPCPAP